MKNLLFTICLLFCINLAFAQIDVVGPAGDVGIGITNPSSKLHIGGDTKVNGLLLLNSSTNSNRITGINDDTRLLVSPNTTVANSNSFFSMYGDEGAGAANTGQFTIGGAYIKFMANKGTGNIGTLAMRLNDDLSLNLTSSTATKPGGGSWSAPSDANLKQDVKAYDKGLNDVIKFNPVQYRYNGMADLDSSVEHVGFIAQEVQKIAPEMVGTYVHRDESNKVQNEYLSVNDSEIRYMLVNAVKELNQIIEKQNAKIDDLQKTVAQLQDNTDNNNNTILIEDRDKAKLGQNTPNPAAGITKVEYFLPEDTKNAALDIFDLNGKLVKSVPLSGSGISNIDLDVNKLSTGLYTYTLRVNDNAIDTKKMIIE